MNRYYPLHLDLTGKRCLVVGGGKVGERKVASLLETGAKIRLVSKTVTAKLRELASQNAIELYLDSYDSMHLDGVTLAFAATDDTNINAQIAADAASRNVWINRADLYEAGDFIVPATVRSGELCISVSTGGNQPLLTARLAGEMQERFGPDYGAYISLLGQMREELKAEVSSPQLRKAMMTTLLDAEPALRDLIRSDRLVAALEYARELTVAAGEASISGATETTDAGR